MFKYKVERLISPVIQNLINSFKMFHHSLEKFMSQHFYTPYNFITCMQLNMAAVSYDCIQILFWPWPRKVKIWCFVVFPPILWSRLSIVSNTAVTRVISQGFTSVSNAAVTWAIHPGNCICKNLGSNPRFYQHFKCCSYLGYKPW